MSPASDGTRRGLHHVYVAYVDSDVAIANAIIGELESLGPSDCVIHDCGEGPIPPEPSVESTVVCVVSQAAHESGWLERAAPTAGHDLSMIMVRTDDTDLPEPLDQLPSDVQFVDWREPDQAGRLRISVMLAGPDREAKLFAELSAELSVLLADQLRARRRLLLAYVGVRALGNEEIRAYLDRCNAEDLSWPMLLAWWRDISDDAFEFLLRSDAAILEGTGGVEAIRARYDANEPLVAPSGKRARPWTFAELERFGRVLIDLTASMEASAPVAAIWREDPVGALPEWAGDAADSEHLRDRMICELAATFDKVIWESAEAGVRIVEFDLQRNLCTDAQLRAYLVDRWPSAVAQIVDIMEFVGAKCLRVADALLQEYSLLRDVDRRVWDAADEVRACVVSPGIVAQRDLVRTLTPPITLNSEYLAQVGLAGLPDSEADRFLRSWYSEMESRTGSALSEGMSDEELAEFETIIDNDAEEMATAWLSVNRPEYQATVHRIQSELAAEVRSAAPIIRAELEEFPL